MQRFKQERIKAYGETFSLVMDWSNSYPEVLDSVVTVWSSKYRIWECDLYDRQVFASLRRIKC